LKRRIVGVAKEGLLGKAVNGFPENAAFAFAGLGFLALRFAALAVRALAEKLRPRFFQCGPRLVVELDALSAGGLRLRRWTDCIGRAIKALSGNGEVATVAVDLDLCRVVFDYGGDLATRDKPDSSP